MKAGNSNNNERGRLAELTERSKKLLSSLEKSEIIDYSFIKRYQKNFNQYHAYRYQQPAKRNAGDKTSVSDCKSEAMSSASKIEEIKSKITKKLPINNQKVVNKYNAIASEDLVSTNARLDGSRGTCENEEQSMAQTLQQDNIKSSGVVLEKEQRITVANTQIKVEPKIGTFNQERPQSDYLQEIASLHIQLKNLKEKSEQLLQEKDLIQNNSQISQKLATQENQNLKQQIKELDSKLKDTSTTLQQEIITLQGILEEANQERAHLRLELSQMIQQSQSSFIQQEQIQQCRYVPEEEDQILNNQGQEQQIPDSENKRKRSIQILQNNVQKSQQENQYLRRQIAQLQAKLKCLQHFNQNVPIEESGEAHNGSNMDDLFFELDTLNINGQQNQEDVQAVFSEQQQQFHSKVGSQNGKREDDIVFKDLQQENAQLKQEISKLTQRMQSVENIKEQNINLKENVLTWQEEVIEVSQKYKDTELSFNNKIEEQHTAFDDTFGEREIIGQNLIGSSECNNNINFDSFMLDSSQAQKKSYIQQQSDMTSSLTKMAGQTNGMLLQEINEEDEELITRLQNKEDDDIRAAIQKLSDYKNQNRQLNQTNEHLKRQIKAITDESEMMKRDIESLYQEEKEKSLLELNNSNNLIQSIKKLSNVTGDAVKEEDTHHEINNTLDQEIISLQNALTDSQQTKNNIRDQFQLLLQQNIKTNYPKIIVTDTTQGKPENAAGTTQNYEELKQENSILKQQIELIQQEKRVLELDVEKLKSSFIQEKSGFPDPDSNLNSLIDVEGGEGVEVEVKDEQNRAPIVSENGQEQKPQLPNFSNTINQVVVLTSTQEQNPPKTSATAAFLDPEEDYEDEKDKLELTKLKQMTLESIQKNEENVQQLKCLTNDISQIKNLDQSADFLDGREADNLWNAQSEFNNNEQQQEKLQLLQEKLQQHLLQQQKQSELEYGNNVGYQQPRQSTQEPSHTLLEERVTALEKEKNQIMQENLQLRQEVQEQRELSQMLLQEKSEIELQLNEEQEDLTTNITGLSSQMLEIKRHVIKELSMLKLKAGSCYPLPYPPLSGMQQFNDDNQSRAPLVLPSELISNADNSTEILSQKLNQQQQQQPSQPQLIQQQKSGFSDLLQQPCDINIMKRSASQSPNDGEDQQFQLKSQIYQKSLSCNGELFQKAAVPDRILEPQPSYLQSSIISGTGSLGHHPSQSQEEENHPDQSQEEVDTVKRELDNEIEHLQDLIRLQDLEKQQMKNEIELLKSNLSNGIGPIKKKQLVFKAKQENIELKNQLSNLKAQLDECQEFHQVNQQLRGEIEEVQSKLNQTTVLLDKEVSEIQEFYQEFHELDNDQQLKQTLTSNNSQHQQQQNQAKNTIAVEQSSEKQFSCVNCCNSRKKSSESNMLGSHKPSFQEVFRGVLQQQPKEEEEKQCGSLHSANDGIHNGSHDDTQETPQENDTVKWVLQIDSPSLATLKIGWRVHGASIQQTMFNNLICVIGLPGTGKTSAIKSLLKNKFCLAKPLQDSREGDIQLVTLSLEKQQKKQQQRQQKLQQEQQQQPQQSPAIAAIAEYQIYSAKSDLSEVKAKEKFWMDFLLLSAEEIVLVVDRFTEIEQLLISEIVQKIGSFYEDMNKVITQLQNKRKNQHEKNGCDMDQAQIIEALKQQLLLPKARRFVILHNYQSKYQQDQVISRIKNPEFTKNFQLEFQPDSNYLVGKPIAGCVQYQHAFLKVLGDASSSNLAQGQQYNDDIINSLLEDVQITSEPSSLLTRLSDFVRTHFAANYAVDKKKVFNLQLENMNSLKVDQRDFLIDLSQII